MTGKRLLVLGSKGQLGRELLRAVAEVGMEAIGLDLPDCDITDPISVREALHNASPDAVINCAAWTRVDDAESHADDAYRINAIGPRVLAGECAHHGVLLVQISTDFVFPGDAEGALDEWAATGPRSVYGASKLAGENEVRALCPRHQIVRTAWLYGQEGPNFVLTMLRLGRERDRLHVVGDQHGSPTWTGHLAPALLRLVDRGVPGTYHLTNSGETTWHGLAAAALEEAGIATPVEAITTAEYPTPATRPANSVLDNRAWRLLGEEPLPDWREGLRGYIAQVGETGTGTP